MARNSREIIKILEQDGWQLHSIKGSYPPYKHPTKKERVTVPHPKGNLPQGTGNSIFKQAGLQA